MAPDLGRDTVIGACLFCRNVTVHRVPTRPHTCTRYPHGAHGTQTHTGVHACTHVLTRSTRCTYMAHTCMVCIDARACTRTWYHRCTHMAHAQHIHSCAHTHTRYHRCTPMHAHAHTQRCAHMAFTHVHSTHAHKTRTRVRCTHNMCTYAHSSCTCMLRLHPKLCNEICSRSRQRAARKGKHSRSRPWVFFPRR